MNTPTHLIAGTWKHPRSRAADYNTIGYWTDLAKTLERGLFDGLFIADVLGVYDVYGGNPGTALRGGVQVPVNDPLLFFGEGDRLPERHRGASYRFAGDAAAV